MLRTQHSSCFRVVAIVLLLLLLLPGQQEDHQGGEAPARLPRQEVCSEGISLAL
jgi:hypothetical protein